MSARDVLEGLSRREFFGPIFCYYFKYATLEEMHGISPLVFPFLSSLLFPSPSPLLFSSNSQTGKQANDSRNILGGYVPEIVPYGAVILCAATRRELSIAS